jgi:splicing factor 45
MSALNVGFIFLVMMPAYLYFMQAVNRFEEGFEFQGRKIRARYYDERKWHAGIWDH